MSLLGISLGATESGRIQGWSRGQLSEIQVNVAAAPAHPAAFLHIRVVKDPSIRPSVCPHPTYSSF